MVNISKIIYLICHKKIVSFYIFLCCNAAIPTLHTDKTIINCFTLIQSIIYCRKLRGHRHFLLSCQPRRRSWMHQPNICVETVLTYSYVIYTNYVILIIYPIIDPIKIETTLINIETTPINILKYF